jgi:hypothetical protein
MVDPRQKIAWLALVLAKSCQGPRVGAAGDQARLRGNQRLGADFDADLRLGTRPPPVGLPQVDAVRYLETTPPKIASTSSSFAAIRGVNGGC